MDGPFVAPAATAVEAVVVDRLVYADVDVEVDVEDEEEEEDAEVGLGVANVCGLPMMVSV